MTLLLRAYLRVMSLLCGGNFHYARLSDDPLLKLLFRLKARRNYALFLLKRALWIAATGAFCILLNLRWAIPFGFSLILLFGAPMIYLFTYIQMYRRMQYFSRHEVFQQLLLSKMDGDEFLSGFCEWVRFQTIEPICLLFGVVISSLSNEASFLLPALSPTLSWTLFLYAFGFIFALIVILIFYKVGLWGGLLALQNFIDGNALKSGIANAFRVLGGQLLCLIGAYTCCIIVIIAISYVTRRIDKANQKRLAELSDQFMRRLKFACCEGDRG